VPLQLDVGISGQEQRDVPGIVILVPMQLGVGISLSSSNGRERMDVIGILSHVPLQLKMGISPSSNGREIIDVLPNESIKNNKRNINDFCKGILNFTLYYHCLCHFYFLIY
jgi:hypothetical protein